MEILLAYETMAESRKLVIAALFAPKINVWSSCTPDTNHEM